MADRGAIPRALSVERVAYWYFRLNGFFQMESFVIHADQRGGQRTDADIVGVRFPYRRELSLQNPASAMADDIDGLGLREHLTDIVIVEVKRNQPCSLNGPWTNPAKQNIHRLLLAIGCLEESSCVEGIARLLYDVGEHVLDGDGLRVRFVAIGREHNHELFRAHPRVTQVTWASATKFIYGRLRRYSSEKRDSKQWDDAGRTLLTLAQDVDEPDFISQVFTFCGLTAQNGGYARG